VLGRITSSQLLATSQSTLASSRSQLARLQQQASTGRAISKPSDDPAGTAAALKVRGEQRATAQYGANIDDGLGWFSTLDSAFSGAEDLVRKGIDITVQGANSGTMSAASREALATQLDGLRADLLGRANTTYLGRTVFAGNSDTGVAFDASYGFSGLAGASVQRRISATETVAVDADGAAAFGTGATSLFATMDGIAAALRSGDDAGVRTGLDALQSGFSALTAQHTVVGARYARLEQAKQDNLGASTTLETQRSGIEDVDATKVLVDLKTQEVGYQTALAVTARVIQPTLMSFLS
jgi:flagellar hook-associated protein 3 FlgL